MDALSTAGGSVVTGTRDIRSARPYFLTPHPVKAFLRRSCSVAALVSLDLCGIALGLYAALAIREIYVGHVPPLWGLLWKAETTWLPFLSLVTLLIFWQRGLYDRRERRAGFGQLLSSVVLIALVALAFGLGTGHEFNTFGLVPTATILVAAFIGLFRSSYDAVTSALMHRLGMRRRALIVASPSELTHLQRVLGDSYAGIEYAFVGAVAHPRDERVNGAIRDIARIVATRRVDEVIIADADVEGAELLEIVEEAHRSGVRVRVAPKTTELLLERAEYVPDQGLPLFELKPPVFAGTDWVVKRAFDLTVSAALLALGFPLWALLAAAIKLTSPGPVLYRDRRVGVNEDEFSMLKFRTMYIDAPTRQTQLEDANEADGVLFKIRKDPRVTPAGALLRRFSLDEVPQLLNVLRGEMSLVGPRPLPLRDYRKLEDWHRKRYLVLPGMTGLWQISGRSNLGFDDLVRLDFYYIENWSIWLDISILLKTIPAVMSRRGAY
ncbi:MAG TPA: sugar transferase [Gaiellaceae bacterium]|nr:sugar transferase [Gaiellaceae bacterium]